MPAELTINEAAHLAGVSTKLVEKSVESGILRPDKVTDGLTRRVTRRLPLAAVPYLSAISDEWLRDLPVARKRRIWSIVSRSRLAPEARLCELRLNESITLDLEGLAGEKQGSASCGSTSRSRWIWKAWQASGRGWPMHTGSPAMLIS